MNHLSKATSSIVQNNDISHKEVSDLFLLETDSQDIYFKNQTIYCNTSNGYFVYLLNNAVYVNKEFFKNYEEYVNNIKNKFKEVDTENLSITVKGIEFVKVFIIKYKRWCVYYASCINLSFVTDTFTYINYQNFLKFKKTIENLNFNLLFDSKDNKVFAIKKINKLFNNYQETTKIQIKDGILKVFDKHNSDIFLLQMGTEKYYFKKVRNDFNISLSLHPDCCGEMIQFDHCISSAFEEEFLKNLDYFNNILHTIYKDQRRSVLATVRDNQVEFLEKIGFVKIGNFNNIKTSNNLTHLFLNINNI